MPGPLLEPEPELLPGPEVLPVLPDVVGAPGSEGSKLAGGAGVVGVGLTLLIGGFGAGRAGGLRAGALVVGGGWRVASRVTLSGAPPPVLLTEAADCSLRSVPGFEVDATGAGVGAGPLATVVPRSPCVPASVPISG